MPTDEEKSVVGLREFLLTVEMSGLSATENVTLNLVASASKTPPAWTAVDKSKAERIRAFTNDKNSREVFFSITDKYTGALNTSTDIGTKDDDPDDKNTPAGIMKPGKTYYVHVYSNGAFVKTSAPVKLNDYPAQSSLPKQISETNSEWPAHVKPGKTYDSSNPSTHFTRSSKDVGSGEMVGMGAYWWGMQMWFPNDNRPLPSGPRRPPGNTYLTNPIEVRKDEFVLFPLRMLMPKEVGYGGSNGPCGTVTDNKPIYQSSKTLVLPFPTTELTIKLGREEGPNFVSFENKKMAKDTRNIFDAMIALTNRRTTPGFFGLTQTMQCTDPVSLTQVAIGPRIPFYLVEE